MYERVIPRDLFNEANLLKCLGTLYIRLEMLNIPNVELYHDGKAFDVIQSEDSGSLHLRNVQLIVNDHEAFLWRPLNSRGAWPLYLTTEEEEEIEVFDEEGALSAKMVKYIAG